MDVKVEAGPIQIGVVAEMVSPVVSITLNVVVSRSLSSLTWTCLTLAHFSINGHSLNAINPDTLSFGGKTMLALA